MAYALMSAGGKDATLALDRARREGLEVTVFASVYDAATGRVPFHHVRRELIAQQAKAFALQLVERAAAPKGFESAFGELLAALRDQGIDGVIFGNVHLADVRAWYEARVTAAGLRHLEPLWGAPGVEIAWEVVERGYRAIIVSVNLREQAVQYLSREFDADVVTELSCTDGIDPCGERGEYHTFVFDGPEFRHPVGFTLGVTSEVEGHRVLDLVPLNGRLGALGHPTE
jgi:uncharacterized protein (TIGR00290 family)